MAEFTDGIGEVRVQLPVGPLFIYFKIKEFLSSLPSKSSLNASLQ